MEADRFWEINHTLAVSLEQVQANFARYGLLDQQVRFLVGWFNFNGLLVLFTGLLFLTSIGSDLLLLRQTSA
jgi:hypothetical protein